MEGRRWGWGGPLSFMEGGYKTKDQRGFEYWKVERKEQGVVV